MWFPSLRTLFVAVSFFVLPDAARAGQVWEIWTRLGFNDNLSKEWLVANDRNWDGYLPPEKTIIYLLIPPRITKVDNHWEITFDPSGRKKDLLTQHFDESQAYIKHPGGYKTPLKNNAGWTIDPTRTKPWLLIRSRNYWDGKFDPPNVDPTNSGTPTAFNLDPSNAVGIAFLEPVVTEQDGQWTLTVAGPLSAADTAAVEQGVKEWFKTHRDPKPPTEPDVHYSAKMKGQEKAWKKALEKWQKSGTRGEAPRLEDFYNFTAKQKAQYEAWVAAKAAWHKAGGSEPFPQPIDFIKD